MFFHSLQIRLKSILNVKINTFLVRPTESVCCGLQARPQSALVQRSIVMQASEEESDVFWVRQFCRVIAEILFKNDKTRLSLKENPFHVFGWSKRSHVWVYSHRPLSMHWVQAEFWQPWLTLGHYHRQWREFYFISWQWHWRLWKKKKDLGQKSVENYPLRWQPPSVLHPCLAGLKPEAKLLSIGS